MAKQLSHTQLSDTLKISEQADGFWLWDDTRGMNLAMRSRTRDGAFTEALTYYQEHLKNLEEKHQALTTKVNSFVNQFRDGDND